MGKSPIARSVRRRVSFDVPETDSDADSACDSAPSVVRVVEDGQRGAKSPLTKSSAQDDKFTLSSDDSSGSESGSDSDSTSESPSDAPLPAAASDVADVASDADDSSGSDSDESESSQEMVASKSGGEAKETVREQGDENDEDSSGMSSSEGDEELLDSNGDAEPDGQKSPGTQSKAPGSMPSKKSSLHSDEVDSGDVNVTSANELKKGAVSSKKKVKFQEEATDENTEDVSQVATFTQMQLDERISWAVAKLGWRRPTPVQRSAIPAALEGRDVLVSAPTGSGKTAAYAVPLAHQLCRVKASPGMEHKEGAFGLVLVPTRELASQVTGQLKKLLKYVQGITVSCLTSKGQARASKKRNRGGDSARDAGGPRKESEPSGTTAFARTADVLVGTPASIVALTKEHGNSVLESVQFVVVDEADLVLGFGHGSDAHAALGTVPTTAQAMLVSATLEAEGLPELQKLVLRSPLTIKVTSAMDDPVSGDGAGPGVQHYFAMLGSAQDRYLVTYCMLRLNVISGKVLIFTNGINSAFRLKLFLDRFQVKSAVLNSELPANSRVHCVEQFNSGIFDILIAADEAQMDDAATQSKAKRRKRRADDEPTESDGEDKNGDAEKNESEGVLKASKGSAKSKRARDEEFGVSRGVDFRGVAAVINFDLPTNAVSYTHRAGRTGRGGAGGTVLTLAINDAERSAVTGMAQSVGSHIGPLAFRMDQIEAFRYRVEDCLRSVTDAAIHSARLTEVRREIVNSDKLRDYFEENPLDLDALKHDGALAKNVPEHLAHVPDYLLPPAMRGALRENPVAKRRRGRRNHGGGSKSRKSDDPLRTFSTQKRYTGTSKERYIARHGVKKKQNNGDKFKNLVRAGKRK